jgi:DNA-binding MarR family transcriptional regulator
MLNHAVAERLGLDPTAWECLTLLFEHGPVTAGRLAELTGLTTGAVTGLVDRLESAGYVRRERDPNDRRRVIVTLVPSALAGVMPLFEPMLVEMHASHARYSDEEMTAILGCLQDAADILRRHALRLRAETAAGRRDPADNGR